MGKLVVLEGAEYWFCVRVDKGGLKWVVVTVSRLTRQQSRGPACYRVLRECLRSLGPVCRAYRCTTGDVPHATAVFVEVTQPPRVPGQVVCPWPQATCGRLSMRLPCGGRCRVCRRPSQKRRRRSRPTTGMRPRWCCCTVHRGRGAGSLWRWSPTPQRCACTTVGRTPPSRSAVPNWKPCTSLSSVATGARPCISRGPRWAQPRSVL